MLSTDFFLANLFTPKLSATPTMGAKSNNNLQNSVTTSASDSKQTVEPEIDYDDIPWVD